DQLVVMYKGQVVESGPALDILQDPQHPYSKRLINAAPSLQSEQASACERIEIRQATQQQVEKTAGQQASDAVMEIDSLTRVFKLPGKGFAKAALDAAEEVNFALRLGTATALVGDSG